MVIILAAILNALLIIAHHCKSLELIELPPDITVSNKEHIEVNGAPEMYEPYPRLKLIKKNHNRRYWLVNNQRVDKPYPKSGNYEDEKDANIKNKIATLVQQTMHDTERRMLAVQEIKDEHREQPPYRAGFILCLIKKSRDVLNELFNVAVKHRAEWKALEQLKIFELIVHTNVDTSNFVRQLVDIHINYLNSSSTAEENNKKRLILI